MPDLPIRRRKLPRVLVPTVALLLLGGASITYLLFADRTPTTFLSREGLVIGTVRRGRFAEYLSVTAVARPSHLIAVETAEAGRVERLVAASGDQIQSGQALLLLANPALAEELALRQTEVSAREHEIRAQEHERELAGFEWGQRLLEEEALVRKLAGKLGAAQELFDRGMRSRSELESAQEALDIEIARLASYGKSREAGSAARSERVLQLQAALEGTRLEIERLVRRLAGLTVRAPVAGRLTSLDALLGQSLPVGAPVASVDPGGAFVLVAEVDEYQLGRIHAGMEAEGRLGELRFPLRLRRISAEVRDGRAEVELELAEAAPPEMRSGSTVVVRIDVGQEADALLLPRGEFTEVTGGAWAFVLDPSGSTARRRSIRLGRQNPEEIEVLSGLQAGERLIVSSYDLIKDRSVLTLSD